MLVLPVEKFMRYLLKKNVNILALVMLLCFSCKKEENVEIYVDAFKKLDTEVLNKDGVYNILFTLQEYPYDEIGLRISSDKGSFFKNKDIVKQPAYQVNKNRYGTFINNLQSDRTYYYQIYVRDIRTSKEVLSDIFSFKTAP